MTMASMEPTDPALSSASALSVRTEDTKDAGDTGAPGDDVIGAAGAVSIALIGPMRFMGAAIAADMSPAPHRARASTASSPAHRRAADNRTRVLATARDASPCRPSSLAIW